MKKIEEYLQRAAECRAMAESAQTQTEHRQQLEEMAKTWEQLAEARRQQMQRKLRLENLESEFGALGLMGRGNALSRKLLQPD